LHQLLSRYRGFYFAVLGSLFEGLRIEGLGSRVQGLGFRVQGLGFRVQGLGFRVQGSVCGAIEFRVELSWFTVNGLQLTVFGLRVRDWGGSFYLWP